VCLRDRLPLEVAGSEPVRVKSERWRLSGVLFARETLVEKEGRGRVEMVARRVREVRKEKETWLLCAIQSFQGEGRSKSESNLCVDVE
jgi:hypothetical protein